MLLSYLKNLRHAKAVELKELISNVRKNKSEEAILTLNLENWMQEKIAQFSKYLPYCKLLPAHAKLCLNFRQLIFHHSNSSVRNILRCGCFTKYCSQHITAYAPLKGKRICGAGSKSDRL